MSKLDALRNATPEVYDVLEALMEGYSDYFYPYSHLEGETGISRKELQKIIKVLKIWGYVVYARGLMNEDGEVAGSGFQIPYELRGEVELAIEFRNLKSQPRQIVIGNKTYKLVEVEL